MRKRSEPQYVAALHVLCMLCRLRLGKAERKEKQGKDLLVTVLLNTFMCFSLIFLITCDVYGLYLFSFIGYDSQYYALVKLNGLPKKAVLGLSYLLN